MARDVVALCGKLKIHHAVFWGFSDGAVIALEIGALGGTLSRAVIAQGAGARDAAGFIAWMADSLAVSVFGSAGGP